jgi:hypothetical protein
MPLDAHELAQFTGTLNLYRHGLVRNVLFTDGAKYVADNAGAYWLLDQIALAQVTEKRVAREVFQLWRLEVAVTEGTLSCEDGNGNSVFSKHIPFTDFPAPGIRLYLSDGTIMLPSEY